MNRTTTLATPLRERTWTRVSRIQQALRARFDALLAEPESRMDDVPWKMILMIGGGVIAVGIVTAIVAFVHAQLGQLPSNPGF